ncbi:MAG: acyl-CoA dehydrogenase C-terminal domain-containing protein, partial [Desulfobacteraceae bacterium]|nr:acyl-CoA dehydrogenase C-terminal domain-containing protein [Desulfobacteraceae bacterium]
RKLGLNKGKPIMDLFGEIQKMVAAAKAIPRLEKQAVKIEEALNKLGEVAIHMGTAAMSEKVLHAFANAHPFQDATGDVTMAWMLLWRAVIAANKLEAAKKKDAPFYEGIIRSLQFFVETQLPITLGRFKALMNVSSVAVDMDDTMFPS